VFFSLGAKMQELVWVSRDILFDCSGETPRNDTAQEERVHEALPIFQRTDLGDTTEL